MSLGAKLQIRLEPCGFEVLDGLHEILAPVLDEARHVVEVIKWSELPSGALLQRDFNLEMEGR